MRRVVLGLLLLGLSLAPDGAALAPLAAAPEPGAPWRLDNGLEVLLRPLPTATSAALALVLRVGERHDPEGASGLAHLAEHCFVTAAAGTCPARSYEQLRARYPEGHNAQTADLHTIVGGAFPPERLEEELAETAARLASLRVTAEDLSREVPRVLLEVENMFERVPALAALNRAREAALPTPGGGRRAGLPEHVQKLTLEQVRGHLAAHYTAGNAVLALAGPFDEQAVRTRIQALFGGLPAGSAPRADVPPRQARAAIDVHAVAGMSAAARGVVCLSFPAPSPTSADYAPFLVLLARLFDPRARPGAAPAPLTFAPLDDPHVAYVAGTLAEKETPEEAVARLRAKVAQVVSAPYGPADALRAANLYGYLLGVAPAAPAQEALNPYAAALGPAARRVLGIDGARLRKELVQVRSLPLGALAARLFDPLASGAAVVTPAP